MKQITSLRGLAIILIILFHLNPEHFPYGYFGVEVFLVISGYLLMKSFQKQQMQIRLGEFARKKVLRLFTPVAVIIPLTLLAGMFFLDYTDLATASSTGGYTLIGAANRFLAVIQSDYFAQDSSGNPFLHMWYLAVTAQIYLLFAGGCVLYRYLPKRAAASLFWIAGIGSFLWAYSYPIHNLLQEIGVPVWEQVRPTSHYMTLPRLWEVCAGILLAIYPPHLKFNTLRKPQEKRSPLSSWNIMHPRACPFPRKGCLPLLGGRSFGDMPGDPV
jgi:acyltransferase 3